MVQAASIAPKRDTPNAASSKRLNAFCLVCKPCVSLIWRLSSASPRKAGEAPLEKRLCYVSK